MSSKSSDMIQRFFLLIALAVSFLFIVTYFLSMGLGILVIFSTPEGLEFSRKLLDVYPLMLIDVKVPVNAGLYFIFLWWIFVICFAAALKYRDGLARRIREALSNTAKRGLFKNNLLAMPSITSMLLVVVLALHGLQTAAGFPTGEPSPGELFPDLIRFSRASLVEEIIFRILPIGAFLVTYIPLAGRKTVQTFSGGQRLKASVLSILQPDKAKEMAGLKTINEHGLFGGMIWAEWLMVVFTALLFGVAHYLGGWGPGKISQAAVTGVVFAVAYLYYGIQAPILLHWFFNYYFSVFSLSFGNLTDVDIGFVTWSMHIYLGAFLWLTVLVFGILAFFRIPHGEKPESQRSPGNAV